MELSLRVNLVVFYLKLTVGLLPDSTVGIVGLGNIGKAVMERLIPFGVKRIVYSGRTEKDIKSSVPVDFVDFEELLKESDFVIVTCSYYPELKHLFNKVNLRNICILSNLFPGSI